MDGSINSQKKYAETIFSLLETCILGFCKQWMRGIEYIKNLNGNLFIHHGSKKVRKQTKNLLLPNSASRERLAFFNTALILKPTKKN